MTETPVEVTDELFAELRKHFSPKQMVELTSAIAWENYRARFDHAFGIEAEGFSAGAVCAVPVGGEVSTLAHSTRSDPQMNSLHAVGNESGLTYRRGCSRGTPRTSRRWFAGRSACPWGGCWGCSGWRPSCRTTRTVRPSCPPAASAVP